MSPEEASGETVLAGFDIATDERQPLSWDGRREVVVAFGRFHELRLVDAVDGPYVDRATGVVHSHEPINLPLIQAQEATLLLR
jgi:hypothetical protein